MPKMTFDWGIKFETTFQTIQVWNQLWNNLSTKQIWNSTFKQPATQPQFGNQFWNNLHINMLFTFLEIGFRGFLATLANHKSSARLGLRSASQNQSTLRNRHHLALRDMGPKKWTFTKWMFHLATFGKPAAQCRSSLGSRGAYKHRTTGWRSPRLWKKQSAEACPLQNGWLSKIYIENSRALSRDAWTSEQMFEEAGKARRSNW
jgi:hypothetical protein